MVGHKFSQASSFIGKDQINPLGFTVQGSMFRPDRQDTCTIPSEKKLAGRTDVEVG